MSSIFSLRAAEPEDYEFLMDMLLEAINWLPGRDFSRDDILTDLEISHYIEGWRRQTDLGVIAVGQDGQPRGGAWLRYLTSDDPGYGYSLRRRARTHYRGAPRVAWPGNWPSAAA